MAPLPPMTNPAPDDTDPAVEALVVEGYRRMSPSQKLERVRALTRAVIVVALPGISMLWIIVSRKNAGLHDLVCRTTVIYDWRAHSAAESRPHE